MPTTRQTWQTVFPASDREIYRRGGYGKALTFGARPAVLLVDATHAFTGTRPMPMREAMKEFPSSCGPSAWKSLPSIKRLLATARKHGIDVIYTTGDPSFNRAGVRTTKAVRDFRPSGPDPNGLLEAIAPRPGELVIRKAFASAFFGTSLATFLRKRGVDTIVLGGSSTSGCVRSTAVDAHSHGFAVFVVEECCFDRSELSHLVNLFEINTRYGTVVRLAHALRWLRMRAVGA